MKVLNKLLIASTAIASFSSFQAQAAGFALYESSARGDAMGGTLLARADSPSALIYNPAGITQLNGTQIELGTALIPPRGTVVIGNVETDVNADNHFVPYAYVTHQFNDNIWLGVSLGSRYGLGLFWPEDWAGRYNATGSELTTISMQPTIAYKINEQFSLAAGLEFIYGDVNLARKVPFPVAGMPDLSYNLSGDAWGLGGVVAAHYQPNSQWRLGLTARTPVKLSFEGEAALGDGRYNSEADITLPGSVALGAAYQLTSKLSVEADLIYTLWSSYDEVEIISETLGTSTMPKDWQNTFRFQLGAEYALTENWDIRAGYVFDQSPIDEHADFMVFPGDRQIFSVGGGYKTQNWNINAAYAYLLGSDATYNVTPYGQSDYKDSIAHILNVSVGFSF